MRAAVADMKIQERLDPAFLETRLDALNARDGVVVDANLSEASLRRVCESVAVPIFADGVSAAKVERLRSTLPRLTALKVNRIEAERLTGISIRDEADLHQAARRLHGQGLARLCVTLGAQGAYYSDPEGAFLTPALPPRKLANTTGAGDALTAGLVWSFLCGERGESAVARALAAASLALEGEQAVNPELSAARVRERMNRSANHCEV